MNQLSGAEALVRMLELHDVEVIFGLCGDTSLPFYDALYRLDHGMRHVLTRDERSASYMADVYARVSGKVGVCEGPSGGGATYILPGVVEANESSIALLAITTDIGVGSRGRFALTELDQEALFRPLTKWNKVIETSGSLPRTLRAAFRQMTTGRPGAVHLGLPFDVQKGPVDAEDVWGDKVLGKFPSLRAAPSAEHVEAAAEALAGAKRPMLICGGGPVIAGARAEVTALAERLGAIVATSISGQGAILDNHPLALGVVGSNGGSDETRAAVDAADLIVLVGCRAGSVTTERWRHPAPLGQRIIHIDADPTVIGANYPTEVAIVGDAKLALAELVEAVDHKLGGVKRSPEEAQATVARAKAAKFARFHALAESNEQPIRPERVVRDLAALLPADSVVVADPGTPCPYFSAYFELTNPNARLISNRAHGALGYSLPGVLGAYYARPSAKCVAVMGDGSFGFNAGEMETLVRTGAPVTLVVFSNSVFGWIKAGQDSGFGQRYFSVDFSQTNHARVAEAFGVKAWRVEHPSELRSALAAAIEHGGPSLVDVVTQPLHEAAAPVTEWIA
ncbi:thiamine pyrophosphate-binding protein [Aurantimonas sp. C2-6-R+9]|uniref:thiamine pyrophosphate-binding protein n=1 Tax=unclassified Aurantimonas TaxID=2638230 RepID=UPI002E179EB5|nr:MULTISPECIES: thiamine pyrophosphate-binding protein [unclassified Aurantimonas]MEC5293150.1 thiamine pyrophosphate-binding protein [Aurantimonas sp. C2-3-R2]MEC5383271.1 thiamine pyrophosphate-binding protein [Aurantimonas sp. C2-6-R+9]MEC5414228.1 thiamine pyrophosphate-binding protein [Aurantimonas sp. C2-4-R8]